MRIALVSDQSNDQRVHDAECRDVAREVTRFRNGPAEFLDMESKWEVAVHIWADIASDNEESGSPEWEAEIRNNDTLTTYLPCCNLPDGEKYASPAK